MQRQFDINKELLIPGAADFLETTFVDYLNPPSRAAFALTSQCHAAFFQSVIERAERSDLHSELISMGFKFDDELDLRDIDIELGRQCLSILKSNHTFSGEKKQFVALLASDRLQSLMSISSWRVAMFCLLTILGLELDKPEIGHAFVTDANLAVFKKLAVKLNRANNDAASNESATQVISAINDCCQALAFAGESALSHAFNVYKYEVYLPSEIIEGTMVTYADQLLIDFIREIQASTHKFTDDDLVRNTPQSLYSYLEASFGFLFIDSLKLCYSNDKRSARWIIGMLNEIDKDTSATIRGFWHDEKIDRLICTFRFIHGCFPAITPDLFEREYNFDCPTTTLLSHHKLGCIQLARGVKRALVRHPSKDISNSAQLTRIVRLFETKEFIRAIVLTSRKLSFRFSHSYPYVFCSDYTVELINLFSLWRFSELINVERSALDTMAKIADVMSRTDPQWKISIFELLHKQLRASAFRPQSLVWKLLSTTRDAMIGDRLRLFGPDTHFVPNEWLFDSALFYHLSLDQRAIEKTTRLGVSAVLLSRCAAYTDDNNAISYLNILLKLPDVVYEEILTLLKLELENDRIRADEYSAERSACYLVNKLDDIGIFGLFYALFKEKKVGFNLNLNPNFFSVLFEDCSLDDIIKLDSIKFALYRSFVDTRSGPASLLSVIVDFFSHVSKEPDSNSRTISIHEAMQLGKLIVAHARNQALITFIKSHLDYISLVENRAKLVEVVTPKVNQDQLDPQDSDTDIDFTDAPVLK